MKKRILLLLILLVGTRLSGDAQTACYRIMSPMVKRLALAQTVRKPTRGVTDQSLCAFVRVEGDGRGVLTGEGCRVLASWGDVYIADIPLSRLSRLSCCADVKRIEAEPGHMLRNDTSAVITRSVDVRLGSGLPRPYAGRGVVLGVVDVGFDVTHPNFYSSGQTRYRVKRFWDQLAYGPSEAEGGTSAYVGTAFADSASILSHARSADSHLYFHGTHTLGTCGGSGASTPYVGMAPEADLCLVSNAVSGDEGLIPEEMQTRYTTATDALAFKYVFDYAVSEGKPCVLSFSEGKPEQFDDECRLYGEVIAQLTGPGRILVAAAGNTGHLPTYLYKKAEDPTITTFLDSDNGTSCAFYVRTAGAPQLRTVVWRSAAERDTLTVSASRLCQLQDSLFTDTLHIAGQSYVLQVYAGADAYAEGETGYTYFLQLPASGADFPKFQIDLVDAGSSAELFAWSGQFKSSPFNPAAVSGESSHCVDLPGGFPSVVCVGATAWRGGFVGLDSKWHRNNTFGEGGCLAGFSSVGPMADGRVKPDVVAPGTNVLSSANSYYDEAHPDDQTFTIRRTPFHGRTYSWRTEMGTSMATPVVAGIIAQWLEANPRLSPDDVKQIFSRTARRLDLSVPVPDTRWGYGEIDAYAGLVDVLGLSGIDGASVQAPSRVSVVPSGEGRVRVSLPGSCPSGFTVRIYSPGGRLVAERSCTAAEVQGVTLQLPSRGVYLVQVVTAAKGLSGSRLVRI